MSNYTQQLRSTGIFFILTLLILLPIISHTPLQTSNPPLQNSSQTNKQFRLGTNFESLDRDMVWNRTYSFSPYDRGYAITECLTGGFALFGETEDSQRQTDLLLIRVDAEGNVLWNSTFGTAEYEGGADFVECLDGGFVLLGNRWGEMFLIRTNSFGHLQWNQSLDSRTGPFGTSIVRCQSGGFAVLCGDYHQTLLLRLDEEGIPLWNKTYDSRPFWSCDTFVECQDGGFAFMGTFPGYVTPPAVMLFRTDTVGNMLWNHTFEFRGYSWGFGLVECEDGGFAFTGTIHDWSILADYLYLVRTDHLGVLIWNNTYGDGCGNSVLQMNSGELVITGFIVGVIASYDDVVFHVVNSSGHVLVDWEIGGAYAQLGNSIIECRDGGFAIIGETYDEADFSNVLLIRIPREAVLNSLQILQWVGVVIVLPILVSVIIAIVTIWLFRSKKVTIHQEEQS